ncbi:lysophospholipid acyltransferase family protein [Thermodesulfobacteriota bacterium]
MSGKSKKKKNVIVEQVVPAITWFMEKTLPFTPLPVIRLSVWCLFLVLYPIAVWSGLVRRYEKNIDIAFQKNKPRAEVRRIARRTLYSWLMNVFEIVHFYHPRNYNDVKRIITIEGLEKINRAKKGGGGVIGITAHFGNFPLMILRLNHENINMSYLFKKIKPDYLASQIIDASHRLNMNPIITDYVDRPSRAALDNIQKGGFVIFVADEFKKTTGVEVEFFDRPTRQAVGPSVISLKTGAPIIPLFIIREKKGRFIIRVEDPIEYSLIGDTSKDIEIITQKRMEIIEKYIRKYPDQWLWIHSRWIER